MAILAKFKCVSVEGPPEWKNLKFEASPDNAEFFRMTPNGIITLGSVNPEAMKQFEAGKEYFVNFISAESDTQATKHVQTPVTSVATSKSKLPNPKP